MLLFPRFEGYAVSLMEELHKTMKNDFKFKFEYDIVENKGSYGRKADGKWPTNSMVKKLLDGDVSVTFMQSFIYSSYHPFIHSSILSFIYSFIH